MRNLSIALVLIASLVACSNDSKSSAAATSQQAGTQQELTPEQLGELGAAIEKAPNDAPRLLNERGLNEESFETAVRKVSEDPAASQRYAGAYKRAKA